MVLKNVIYSIFCLASIEAGFCYATENHLELFSDQGEKKVTLPFSYKHLDDDDKENCVYVPERFYTVLSDNMDIAIVGPLQPCLFVALHNEENNKTIVFHKHYSNHPDSIVNIAINELQYSDPSKLKGIIFTNKMPAYEIYMMGIFGPVTMKGNHENRSQLDEIKYVKDTLIRELGIQDRTRITAKKFNSKMKDFELGDYEFSELFLYVNRDLELRSVCPMYENFFGDFSHLSLNERVEAVSSAVRKATQKLTIQNFLGAVEEKDLNTYGKAPFVKI